MLLAVFAAVSSLTIVVAALAGFRRAPMGWMLIAFALSGKHAASDGEERMSVQGVERTAVRRDGVLALGFLLFALISLLPALSVLAVSDAAVRRVRAAPQSRCGANGTGRIRGADAAPASGRRQSARIVVARSLWEADGGYFARVLRLRGDAGERRDRRFRGVFRFHGALAGVPALASFVAILLAYLFYRAKNAMLAFYLAFPLMALWLRFAPGIA